MENTLSKKQIRFIILGSILFVIIVIIIFNCFTTVPTGKVGIKTRWGKVIGEPLNEGLNIKTPFIEKIVIVDCRTQKLEVECDSASKDLQTIVSTIAVNYSVDKSKANELYRNIGMSYENTIIYPAIQESIKSVSANYTAEELITKRNEVSIKMLEKLSEKVKLSGILVSNINIVNFDFSEEFDKAIELKQVAQQNVLKAKEDLERTKIEAAQKIELAKAEAESIRLQKQEITEEILELRKIEAELEAIKKWDGKLPTTNATGTIPFLNID